MKQNTFEEARELNALIENLKQNKELMMSKINFSRHTNTDQYHKLTVRIEKEVSTAIAKVFDKYIEQYQSEFDNL